MTPHAIIKTVPIFASVLDAAQLEALAGQCAIAEFPRGTVLMRQGEMGASMFAITRGSVSVSVHLPGGRETVATLGPGDVVGEISLLTGAYRNATVTVARPLTALEIGKEAISAILAETPGLYARFAGVIEQRQAELKQLRHSAARSGSAGLDRHAIENLMRSFFKS